MTHPILPEDTTLNALEHYGTLESLHGEGFDDLARLAAFICQTSIGTVTIVDSTCRWLLSNEGFRACGSSREVSFCVQALVGPDLLIVPDACLDARFAGSPLVSGEPFVRFFVSLPLVTPDGHVLGTLCVLDYSPRTLRQDQYDALESFSRVAAIRLERRRLKQELQRLRNGV